MASPQFSSILVIALMAPIFKGPTNKTSADNRLMEDCIGPGLALALHRRYFITHLEPTEHLHLLLFAGTRPTHWLKHRGRDQIGVVQINLGDGGSNTIGTIRTLDLHHKQACIAVT